MANSNQKQNKTCSESESTLISPELLQPRLVSRGFFVANGKRLLQLAVGQRFIIMQFKKKDIN